MTKVPGDWINLNIPNPDPLDVFGMDHILRSVPLRELMRQVDIKLRNLAEQFTAFNPADEGEQLLKEQRIARIKLSYTQWQKISQAQLAANPFAQEGVSTQILSTGKGPAIQITADNPDALATLQVALSRQGVESTLGENFLHVRAGSENRALEQLPEDTRQQYQHAADKALFRELDDKWEQASKVVEGRTIFYNRLNVTAMDEIQRQHVMEALGRQGIEGAKIENSESTKQPYIWVAPLEGKNQNAWRRVETLASSGRAVAP